MSPYGPFGNESQRNTACPKIRLLYNILLFKLIIQIFNELINLRYANRTKQKKT